MLCMLVIGVLSDLLFGSGQKLWGGLFFAAEGERSWTTQVTITRTFQMLLDAGLGKREKPVSDEELSECVIAYIVGKILKSSISVSNCI